MACETPGWTSDSAASACCSTPVRRSNAIRRCRRRRAARPDQKRSARAHGRRLARLSEDLAERGACAGLNEHVVERNKQEETLMATDTNTTKTVGLLVEASKLDTVYRDLYLKRARQLLSAILDESAYRAIGSAEK